MKQFYISDTHFGHTKIIKLCNRPFSSVEEMNEEMVKRWNSVVGNDDVVYHLGDFGWRGNDNIWKERLKGNKIFLQGNHDSKRASSHIETYAEIKDGPFDLVLCHYPIVSWNGFYKGAFHFYGHVHTEDLNYMPLDWRARAFNVGAEALNYTPMTAEEIIMAGNT